MTGNVNPRKRRYDVTRRQVQALQSRERILEAALDVFVRDGYGARMTNIASAAGVSLDTLYATFGPKPKLVRYLIEVALSGTGRPVPALERDWVVTARLEPDPVRLIEMLAAGASQMLGRLAPLWIVVLQGAAQDEELKEMVEVFNQRRLESMRTFVEDLAARGGLRPDLGIDTAADTVWATNTAELYTMMTVDRGWTPGQFQVWLTDCWKRLLLPSTLLPAEGTD